MEKNNVRQKSSPAVRAQLLESLLHQLDSLKIDPKEIRAERKKTGLTQAQMAKALNVSTRTYEEYESGRNEMHPNHFFVMRCIAQVHTSERKAKKRSRAA